MRKHFIEWEIVVRAIFPFTAAAIFALVLIYFTLVRHRIGKPYPYFAIFITCFIFFLCTPLLKITTPRHIAYWLVSTKNILLFAVAFPALLSGVFILAKQPLSRIQTKIPYLIGSGWALFYLLFRVPDYFKNDSIANVLQYDFITLQTTYIGSTLFIIFVIMLPCIYLLIKNTDKAVRLMIFGVLLLCMAVLLGHNFKFWVLMNFCCALTAFIWCWPVYNDIKQTNKQLAQYHQHEKSLAKAQYTAMDANAFNDHYAVEKNLAYPLREREALLEVVRTASAGLITDKVSEFFTSLQNFSLHNHNTLITHVRETLFILVDTAIFSGANAQHLTKRLETKGIEINECVEVHELETLLKEECCYLCEALNNANSQKPEEQLVDSIKNYVLTHYFKNINISDIVQNVGTSQSHIMRIFKRMTNQTINQYIAEVRIEKSKLLLLSKSVTESAYEAGFNDSNYFSTVFKKQTGLTPKQYQLQSKQPENLQ